MARRGTSTSNFGVSRRESHDASAFYGRFQPPALSDDDTVLAPAEVAEPFVCGDSRHMTTVADGSVALVVTSPPYFAGKQYEEELERDGVPGSYLEYLEFLTDVFAECTRTLEPGGRIAVNVANLGRKPYRSLSSDVVQILQDRLGLLLRGEIIWRKGEGASGSCAWGSYRSPANPVLRDVTERVVVASKGRFDRARSARRRAAEGLPSEATILTDDFMAQTLDVWELPPESAHRVNHPAPFPVELPERLIALYTYTGDLVLDPLMGSGSALVAASRLGRRFVGYDLDPAYVEIARARVAAEGAPAANPAENGAVQRVAETVLADAGFTIVQRNARIRGSGVTVDVVAVDADGERWLFDVAGTLSAHRGGLQRADVLWRTLGQAAAVRAKAGGAPLVVLASPLPRPRSDGDLALRAAGPQLVHDVVDLLGPEGRARLEKYAAGGYRDEPLAGFWTAGDLARGRG